MVSAFFGFDAVIRVVFSNGVDDDAFGMFIDFADIVVAPFFFNIEPINVLQLVGDEFTGFFRRNGGNI